MMSDVNFDLIYRTCHLLKAIREWRLCVNQLHGPMYVALIKANETYEAMEDLLQAHREGEYRCKLH